MDSNQINMSSRGELDSSLSHIVPSNSQHSISTPSPSAINQTSSSRDLEKISSSHSSTAVVAPAASSSFQPISANSHSFSLQHSSNDSHTHTLSIQHNSSNNRTQEKHSNVGGEPPQKLKFDLQSFIHQVQSNQLDAALLSNPAFTSAAASIRSMPAIECECMCLIVDDDHETFKQATHSNSVNRNQALSLAAGTDKLLTAPQLKQHLLTWLQGMSSSDIVTAYTTPRVTNGKPLLHINFSSLESLSQAQLNFPFLVRCGVATTEQTTVWRATQPACNGRLKNSLPELLKLTVTPSDSNVLYDASFKTKVKRMLDEMQLPYSTFWFPNSNSTRYGNKSQVDSTKKSVFVLPRQVTNLIPVVEQLHHRFTLAGGKVSVQGVNTTSLQRCSQCDTLGHAQDKCTRYRGAAIRLIGMNPFSYLAMKEIQSRTGAHNAFIGSNMNDLLPSRRLFLLSDAQSEDELKLFVYLVTVLAGELKSQGKLYGEPQAIEINQRRVGCRECGHKDKNHECPFAHNPHNNKLAAVQPPNTASAVPSASPSSAAGPSAAADKMCRSWRAYGNCRNQSRCPFEHPIDHTPQKGVCYLIQADGKCKRGEQCPFVHPNRPAAAPTASEVAPPSADAVSPSAADGSAAAVNVSEASAPTASATAKSSNSRRSSQQPTVSAAAQPMQLTNPFSALNDDEPDEILREIIDSVAPHVSDFDEEEKVPYNKPSTTAAAAATTATVTAPTMATAKPKTNKRARSTEAVTSLLQPTQSPPWHAETEEDDAMENDDSAPHESYDESDEDNHSPTPTPPTSSLSSLSFSSPSRAGSSSVASVSAKKKKIALANGPVRTSSISRPPSGSQQRPSRHSSIAVASPSKKQHVGSK